MGNPGRDGCGKRRKLLKKVPVSQRPTDDSSQNGEVMTPKQEEAYRNKMKVYARSAVKTMKVSEAMDAAVSKCTSKELSKKTKFLKNDGYIAKACNFVMNKLQPAELQGLTGKELIRAQEVWKELHAPVITKAINKHRCYVNGELQKWAKEAFKQNRKDIPNKKEIRLLMERENLDSDTAPAVRKDMEAKLVTYVNEMLPKVAGNKYFGPGTRHYECPSFFEHPQEVPEGSNLDDYVQAVSEADEAFLVLLWENSYDKWVEQDRKYKVSVEENKKDPNKPIYEAKEDKTDYKLPYTNPKAGNNKYGGYTKNGIILFDKMKAAIMNNRAKNEQFIKDVEVANLIRIQKKEEIIQPTDTDRKTKKRKGKAEAQFADEDAGEEDNFDDW